MVRLNKLQSNKQYMSNGSIAMDFSVKECLFTKNEYEIFQVVKYVFIPGQKLGCKLDLLNLC